MQGNKIYLTPVKIYSRLLSKRILITLLHFYEIIHRLPPLSENGSKYNQNSFSANALLEPYKILSGTLKGSSASAGTFTAAT